MGDRTTPMKFGPEWLRNLSREPTTSPGSGAGGGAPTTLPIRPALIVSASSNTTTPPNTSKVLLAKLRYGREEMLALYDRQNVEAPQQLKSIDLLYQPRGKPPYALNNNFEDDTRDINMRNNPPVGGISSSDRFVQGRGRGGLAPMGGEGRGRGAALSENRGRSRGFVRQASLGSDNFRSTSWHNGSTRTYSVAPDDDPNPPRMWNNGVGMNPPGIRPSVVDQAEWANKAPYRKNRQNHTNWRQQPSRDEGEEWRSSDGARRGQEKWEREWPERNSQEKSWSSNRRQWGGDNNDDSLPEWAVDNAEACGGTFDSSGAFHGYSNDDSNIPKMQESPYPLARSHTHGSFGRPRSVEEDEWWASEKAKKLSTKRFDATEVKFKKHVTTGISEENASENASASPSNTVANASSGQIRDRSKVEGVRSKSASSPTHEYSPELQDEAAALPAKREELKHDNDKQKERNFQANYTDNTQPSAQHRIDMLLRSEEQDSSNERGNYKSVMMTPNNNHLRQKHQNIGTPTNGTPKRIAMLLDAAKQRNTMNKPSGESDDESQQIQHETKLVEDLLDMNLNEELQAQLVNASTQAAGMPNHMSSPGLQMRMNPLLNQNMAMKQQNPAIPSTPGMPQGNTMRPVGITNSLLNASLGLPIGTGSNMGMPLSNMPTSNPGMLSSTLQGLGNSNMQNPMQGMQSSMQTSLQQSGMQGMQQSAIQGMQQSGMQGMQQSGMPGMQQSGMPGMQQSGMQSSLQQSGMQSSMQQSGMQSGLQQSGMQAMQSGMQGMQSGIQGIQSGMQGIQSGMQGSGMQGNGFQPSNSMPASVQSGMNNLQPGSGMIGYQGVGNNSLFMQGSQNNVIPNASEMSMHGQQSLYPLHGHAHAQGSYGAAMYGNMLQQPTPGPLSNIPLTEQWYYEDPKKTIQGPFTTKEMCNWYRAGFFSPDLMVRRACESGLRPLINYGVLPFGPMDLMTPPYNQLAARFDMRPQSHNGMINQQGGLGPEVESLWNIPSNDMMWVQQSATPRDDNRINMSMYVWDQPSGMSNSLLPDAKDMKTEDEILAQMRASQAEAAQNLTFMSDAINPEDAFTVGTNIAPNLEELQKLIGGDIHGGPGSSAQRASAADEVAQVVSSAFQHTHLASDKEKKPEPVAKTEPVPEVSAKQLSSSKVETKPAKQSAKVEEKPAKAKEVTATKTKTKKQKEDKKEDASEIKAKEEEKKTNDKRSEEPSPPKSKKEDKANKKDLDKEKKEWLKDGFTIVKGTEKKENKKKEKEEARAAEEAEKKRKEEEKRALIEAEKNRAPEPVTRRQQMEISQAQRQLAQTVAEPPKKAPWSAPSGGRDGLALSDIQRLEREKKLEQMKEQQQMMHVIAQQQAIAVQREQEIAAGQLGWAKKKQPNNSPPGQTLAEIQAEARLQAAAIAAAATAAAREEAQATPPPVNITPWGATNGGFWDSPSSAERAAACVIDAPRVVETKPVETKPKKRVTVVVPPKKETSPAADFESWCTNILANWKDAANIDIPTFIAFLRDIESPYEVKDYVKCYLGDGKEANDFARQFLERRSRLLRVGMVTPSDDLCSPAAAINPRTNSGSDYTEVKSKGKKTKKNKMFKVDARILGFSVTASEDRINIGDIDSV